MWFLGVAELCSFTEQTFVDPLLWAGCRAWCWGYRDEEGACLALELQSVWEGRSSTGVGAKSTGEGCWRWWYGTCEGGVAGELGRLHRGRTLDLGLEGSAGENWGVGDCSPSRTNRILGISFPMMDGDVPSCPSFCPRASVTQELIRWSCCHACLVWWPMVGRRGRGKSAGESCSFPVAKKRANFKA